MIGDIYSVPTFCQDVIDNILTLFGINPMIYLRLAWIIVLLPILQSPAIATESDFVCYMQTSDHRILDLTNLCQKTKTAIPIKDDLYAEVAVSELSYDRGSIRGQITNQTGKTVRSATVNYAIVDAQGKELDSGSFNSEHTIAPGASIPFQTGVHSYPNAKVQITSVDWQD